MTDDLSGPTPSDGPLESAVPPASARILAVASIVLAGVCGGLIGWKFTDLQVDDGSIWPGIGGFLGAVVAAGGVAVLAVLVMRAMNEWSTIQSSGDPTAARRRRS